jgi:tritrans,polycis-undecaprenyl-diphosphate synthase [geranylgeranyl-diphosphate specific]
MPEHIGIILDGNRRWASQRMFDPLIGHDYGAKKVEDLLDWCLRLNVKTVTMYVFSMENFMRSQKEVGHIMQLAETKLNDLLANKEIHEYGVRIKVIGRLDLLPENVRALASKVEESTKNYSKYYLNVALAYGGRAEIVDATRKIAMEVKEGKLNPKDINEDTISKHLYTSHLPRPDLDLIIRTSGEERLSNFLLWQGAYSELYFLDVYWPDFRKIDLWRAIRTYQLRSRRFGH